MAIIITSTPQTFTPAYNAVNFTFSGNNFTKQGFRYLVDVYSGATGTTLLSKFKITPLIDGTGKIDISRVLINYLGFTFNPNIDAVPNATESYMNYNVKIGEEYQAPSWDFTGTTSFTAGTNTFTRLNGTTLPPYIIGDQILVKTPNTALNIYGLHKVTLSGANFIGVNVLFQTGSTSGQTFYADGRKVAFSGITGTTGLTVFNGVDSFQDFITWSGSNYNIILSSTTKSLVTDLPPNNFYATPTQDIKLNTYVTMQNGFTYFMIAVGNDGILGQTTGITTTTPNVKQMLQFNVGFSKMNFGLQKPKYYDVMLFYTTGILDFIQLSKPYRIWVDYRCKIEDYEIAFVDRMGSIGSFAFQLRSKDTGTISRIQYKQQVPDNYKSIDRGTTNIYITEQKDIQLNTDWMTDEMSVYFEQLLTSQNTWIKVNGVYQACTIIDSSFVIERQKNKRLIQKTVTVRLANNDNINC